MYYLEWWTVYALMRVYKQFTTPGNKLSPIYLHQCCVGCNILSLIARFMGPTWGLLGADRTQVGPMWATWTLLFRILSHALCQPTDRCASNVCTSSEWGTILFDIWCNNSWNILRRCYFLFDLFLWLLSTGLIQGLHPANERCHCIVKTSLIGWVQT